MAALELFVAIFCLLFVPSAAPLSNCSETDYVKLMLPCDEKTVTRSLVYYLNATCKGGFLPPTPIHGLPCYCRSGEGIINNTQDCRPCMKGEFGPRGEVISDWDSWTENGTKPPEGSNIINYCENAARSFNKRPCNNWKASGDSYTLESGDNSLTRCVTSVLLITRKFILSNSTVSFDYRVDSRNCGGYYVGCDGLAFYINNNKVLDYAGNVFRWSTKTYLLEPGTHTLKWIYRKSCYSFGNSFVDRAFIRSITLVGTDESNARCTKCPPGHYSNVARASNCTPCSYFEYQSKKGQQQCDICPPDTYAMLGASKCLPLPNCTDDDLIEVPGNLDTCSCFSNNTCTTTLQPTYVKVKGFKTGPRLLCNYQDYSKLKKKQIQCRCQPGYQIIQKDGKAQCKPCDQRSFSSDGVTCQACKAGFVALRGKHFYIWKNNTLSQEGFSPMCYGDCSVEGGWIPAGGDIRTERVVGNVFTVLQSPKVEVVSEWLGQIMFNCSVTCNLTGVPRKAVRGEHLAQTKDCNLEFQVWNNGSLQEQMNCTLPKGRYVYGHETKRDGQIMTHVVPLKKGNYTFRWIFHQQDETRTMSTAFQGKIFNISILGTKDGLPNNCIPCPGGYRSILGNTEDCEICPNGTASEEGSTQCTPCEGDTFAAKTGSKECLPCGSHTHAFPKKDGCSTNGCKFIASEGVEYDLNNLSRPGGPMFRVLPYRPSKHKRSHIWPYIAVYVNLCTLDHDNTSCVKLRDRNSGERVPLPVMACRASWIVHISMGSVMGYRAKKDVRSGLFVDLLHGDRCFSGPGREERRYKTTLDLRCNVNAGVGNPGPENNRTRMYQGCEYYFVWESLYACPVCKGHEVTKIFGECINGTRNVTFVRSVPCWGTGGHQVDETANEPCEMSDTNEGKETRVLYLTQASNVIKVVIGVCVGVFVVLLGIAIYFVYKHRTLKYRYFNALTRNKPMSRLAEEDELGEQFD
ncbi:endosome/lysosome-associated apoptosis and autophagy regulator family member 2-like isoform X1 [Montipora foliosa]|uniref:endosome/lysosome-associated apoptosis and autophagy regulator family member 2-like isoform X1 n=2 Tax=Montipora foliosa TaxID=591990 RepID=UPI0035F1BABC